MTDFAAILAFPAGTPRNNNDLICSVVEELDRCGCTVTKITFDGHQYSLGTPRVMSLIARVSTSCPLDNADAWERERWLLRQFDLNSRLPDCAVVEI